MLRSNALFMMRRRNKLTYLLMNECQKHKSDWQNVKKGNRKRKKEVNVERKENNDNCHKNHNNTRELSTANTNQVTNNCIYALNYKKKVGIKMPRTNMTAKTMTMMITKVERKRDKRHRCTEYHIRLWLIGCTWKGKKNEKNEEESE